jgi:hypothetical protein
VDQGGDDRGCDPDGMHAGIVDDGGIRDPIAAV